MKVDKKLVGLRIKNILLNKGYTLEEFGKLFNANKALVSKWVKGTSLPGAERIKAIAKIGDITVNELLYGNEGAAILQLQESVRTLMNLGFTEKDIVDSVKEVIDYYGRE